MFHDLDFRRCLGKFPTGITVISTRRPEGGMDGMVVNSFTSVSLSPPLILWCLRRESTRYELFRSAKRFAVNILGFDQAHLVDPAQKLCNPAHYRDEHDVPVLIEACAELICETTETVEAGDHTIIIGHVLAVGMADRQPLIWAESGLRTLGDPVS